MRVGTRLVSVFLATTAAIAAPAAANAQTPGTSYHRAPDAIAKALETPPPPAVALSPDHRTMAILGRENLPSITNLSKPILRLAGYRIDPATNGQAEVRIAWLNALSFQDVASGRTVAVKLPQGTRFAAPDAERIRMTLDGSGDQAVTPDMIDALSDMARRSLRIEGGGYRRDDLRAFAQRVEVADDEVRIMGRKSDLLQTLVAASSGETAAFAVRSYILKWRARGESDGHSDHWEIRVPRAA